MPDYVFSNHTRTDTLTIFFLSIKCLPLLKIFVIIVLLQCLLRRLYPKRYHDYSNGGHFR